MIVAAPVPDLPSFHPYTNWSMAASYLRHCADLDWAPVTMNRTRHAAASAAPWASLMRVPAASPSATLTGTVDPSFHFDPGTGEKNPRIRYS